MVIYHNSLITISYASASDILTVEWPDFGSYATLEVKESLNKLVEVLKDYDAKYLLIDASNAKVEVGYTEYQRIIRDFLENLNKTRMKKLARLMTSDPEREANINSLRQDNLYGYEFQDFKTRADAIKWLTNQK